LPPVNDSNKEEEKVMCRFSSGDHVLNDEEEATAIQQVTVISEAEARAWFHREEEETVR
jgi:hypothetical protein